MIIQSLIRCLLLFGLMTRVRSSPPTTTIDLPLLEEKTVGKKQLKLNVLSELILFNSYSSSVDIISLYFSRFISQLRKMSSILITTSEISFLLLKKNQLSLFKGKILRFTLIFRRDKNDFLFLGLKEKIMFLRVNCNFIFQRVL